MSPSSPWKNDILWKISTAKDSTDKRQKMCTEMCLFETESLLEEAKRGIGIPEE
jgi:hypothetical protein